MWLARTTLFLILASVLAGQPVLHLKSREATRVYPRQTQLRHATPLPHSGARRRNLGQKHWIVQFRTAPSPDQIAALRSGGARILGYVPDFGFSISAADNTQFASLDLNWAGNLEAKDKTSAMLDLTQDQPAIRSVVVEFYPDVDMNDARTIVSDMQMSIQENPDLLDHDLLVSGNLDQIAGLGEWDEVEYIFPASAELTQGTPVHACAGALTDQGTIAQSILRVGDGWDGPGKNAADLNYTLFNMTPKLTPEGVVSEIVRAFSEWAKYAKLTFTKTDGPEGSRTLAVLFGSRDHGDGYPFDGAGGILAHTYYPFPANPEPIAGDLHFDADENWNIGTDVDLFSVALHETGHALGLGHSDRPGSVMYPYYRKSTALTDDDIKAVLSMYAAQDGLPSAATPLALTVNQPGVSAESSITLSGATSGGSGPIQVSWISDRGFSGVATISGGNWSAGPIPLNIGTNTITITAKDAHQAQAVHALTVTRQPDSGTPGTSGPQLDITAPATGGTFVTNTSTTSVSGTASSPSGIARVMWSNSRGGSGQAVGTANWSTGAIALQTGTSTITVTAYAQNGVTSSRSLQVSYSAGIGTDTAPPSIAIVSPSFTTLSTAASSISVTGTARDIAGVATVTWANSTGTSGTATGTSSWAISTIPLLIGTNTITIRATNLAGLVAWRSIVVTRI